MHPLPRQWQGPSNAFNARARSHPQTPRASLRCSPSCVARFCCTPRQHAFKRKARAIAHSTVESTADTHAVECVSGERKGARERPKRNERCFSTETSQRILQCVRAREKSLVRVINVSNSTTTMHGRDGATPAF
jgi:hypothetical protein